MVNLLLVRHKSASNYAKAVYNGSKRRVGMAALLEARQLLWWVVELFSVFSVFDSGSDFLLHPHTLKSPNLNKDSPLKI
jgi:hypothetical protein